jgi:hypothetical protein
LPGCALISRAIRAVEIPAPNSTMVRRRLELGRQLAARIPGALFYPFEGRCHLCMVTATEEFCDVLRQFILTGRISTRVEVAQGSEF